MNEDQQKDQQIDLNKNDKVQTDLEAQLDEASTEKNGTEKNDEGASPDLGTAKAQMNEEDGIEIL